MIQIRIAALILLMAASAPAQTPDTIWTRAYGGTEADMVESFIQTSDGAYLVAGYTISYTLSSDFYLVKFDSQGQTIFENYYEGNGVENALSVFESDDGGYIFSGYTHIDAFDDEDIYLGKTDSEGTLLWSQVYGQPDSDEFGQSVLETVDHDIVIAGYVIHHNPTDKNVLLMKTDATGVPIWSYEFGSSGEDVGLSVISTLDGGYVISGSTTSYGNGSGDIYLIKTNSDGGLCWYRTYGFSNWEEGLCVIETSDGGFAIVGRTNSVGNGWWDVYLVKTDSTGDLEWWRTYGGEDWDGGRSVVEVKDGGFLIGGYTFSYGPGAVCFYLIRTDAQGNEIWSEAIGGPSADWGHKAMYGHDGYIYFAGDSWSYGHGSVDVYVVKLEGHPTATAGHDIPNPGSIELKQNFPNPFNSSTNIRFYLSGKSNLLIEIYNIMGQKVAELFEGSMDTGYHTITWDSDSEPSGVYFTKIRVGEEIQTCQLVLLK